MKNLWEKEFKPMDIETPREIIENQCSILSKLTKEKIIARVAEYDGPIFSYTKKARWICLA